MSWKAWRLIWFIYLLRRIWSPLSAEFSPDACVNVNIKCCCLSCIYYYICRQAASTKAQSLLFKINYILSCRKLQAVSSVNAWPDLRNLCLAIGFVDCYWPCLVCVFSWLASGLRGESLNRADGADCNSSFQHSFLTCPPYLLAASADHDQTNDHNCQNNVSYHVINQAFLIIKIY